MARPCKDAIQVQPLLGINKARNILLHGISAPASAAPAVPTHPTAGSLSAFLPGCSSRTQRGAATLARPLASASGIATTSRIAATLVTRPGEDAGVLGGGGRGGDQARAFAWVPSELGTHGEKSYCKLWGVPSLSGAALSAVPHLTCPGCGASRPQARLEPAFAATRRQRSFWIGRGPGALGCYGLGATRFSPRWAYPRPSPSPRARRCAPMTQSTPPVSSFPPFH